MTIRSKNARKARAAAIAHQKYLRRYENTVRKQLTSYIASLVVEANKLLKVSGTEANKVRISALIAGLKEHQLLLNKAVYIKVKDEMTILAQYEAQFTNKLFKQQASVPFETVVPTATQLKSAAFTDIMAARVGKPKEVGYTIQRALSTYGAEGASRITKVVRDGYATGKTIAEMTKAITEIGASVGKARTLSRTITNHVASSSRLEFYKSNDDIIIGYEVVVTHDDRLSDICEELDGQRFSKEEFKPPPYHFGCRSTFIGVVDPEFAI